MLLEPVVAQLVGLGLGVGPADLLPHAAGDDHIGRELSRRRHPFLPSSSRKASQARLTPVITPAAPPRSGWCRLASARCTLPIRSRRSDLVSPPAVESAPVGGARPPASPRTC